MIRKLLSSVREYKKESLLAPICVAIEAIMDVVLPILMASLIDKGIGSDTTPGSTKILLLMGLAILVCSIISLVFGVLSGKYAAEAMAGFSKNLRHDIFYKVQTFSFANIDKFSASSIITRLTTDVMLVQNTYAMVIRIAVRVPLMLIFSLVMAFSINAKLSWIFVATIPVFGGGLLLIAKFVHPTFVKMFTKMDDLNRVVQENLHGIRVVKSFVRENHEVKKFKNESQEVCALNSHAERILALNSPLMQSCMYFCILLVSFLGAKIIVNSGSTELTTGYLTSLISYATQILFSLNMLSMIYVMITISRAAMERIVELEDETADIVSPENAVTEVKDGSIDFENVSFSYSKDPDHTCLDDIDLHINSGETIGILGGTGSSKTTLVQLIPRLYDATVGTVKVGGIDVREYDVTALRDSVSMVLQKNELFAGTIYQNLRWGNEDATDEEIERVAQLAQADQFVKAMPEGYNTFIEQGGTNVSGGQKQRLCIARAILSHPKILILDDSTSAVDTRTDALIRKAFMDEIPDTTKLIIAQRIASVEEADKIIVLDNGRINGFGTHEELLANNTIYREVYESQKKGGDSDAE